MFQRVAVDLVSDLATAGTLVLPTDFDEFRLASAGHILANYTTDKRYVSPTDFTLTADGSGNLTITWLHADTLAAGAKITLGVAYIDAVIGGSVGTSGGSGGAVTVADGASVALGSRGDLAFTGGVGNATLIALMKAIDGHLRDTTTPAKVTSPAPSTVAVTIANGASMSGVFSAEGKFVGVTCPNAWNGTGSVYLEWSADGSDPTGTTGWYPVWDTPDGAATPRMLLSNATLAQNSARHFPLELGKWLSGGFLRLRSGSYSGVTFTAENRTADRTFILAKAG